MATEECRKSRPSADNRRAKCCFKINAEVLQRSFVGQSHARYRCDMVKPSKQTLKMLAIVLEKHVGAFFQKDDRRRVEEQRIKQDIVGQRKITFRRLHAVKCVVPCRART